MTERRYLTKAGTFGELASQADVLAYFDALNADDWHELLVDVCRDPAAVRRVLRPRHGDELPAYLATFLASSSTLTRRLIANGVESVLRQSMADPQCVAVLLYLVLAADLPVDARLLKALTQDTTLPQEIRLRAGNALASIGEVLNLPFWQSIDYATENSFLAPTAMTALTDVDPERALELLAASKIDAPDSFHNAAERAVASIARRAERHEWLVEFVEAAPPPVAAIIRSVPSYEAVAARRQANAERPRELATYSRWQRLADIALETRTVPYYYTGYLDGRLFSPEIRPPDCLYEFLNGVRRAIRRTLGRDADDIDLELQRLETDDLNRLVDDVRDGAAFLAEPSYATAARGQRADFARVGVLGEFGIVIPAALKTQFEAQFDIPKGPRGIDTAKRGSVKFSALLRYALADRVGWIIQPSTAISELRSEMVTEMRRRTEDSGGVAGRPEMTTIDKLDIILDTLCNERGPRKIAVLDANTADTLRQMDTNGRVYSYRGSFDSDIAVGFMIPGRDPEFATNILGALQESLFDPRKLEWNAEFRELMLACRVRLDERPSLIRWSGSGWDAITMSALAARSAPPGS